MPYFDMKMIFVLLLINMSNTLIGILVCVFFIKFYKCGKLYKKNLASFVKFYI